MKIINLTIFLAVFTISISYSQAPFSTPFFEPIVLEEKTDPTTNKIYFEIADRSTQITDNVIKPSDNKIDFFKNNSLALSILNEGENRASISSQVLHYKLYFANPDPSEYDRQRGQSDGSLRERIADMRNYKMNIPLFLISKLSSTYDSTNSASSVDLLDYEASPVTLRIMPSFEVPLKGVTDRLFFGFYADMRGLNLYDNTSNDYDLEIMGSGGIGFTYQSDGEAGVYNTDGNYKAGRYSISAMLQGATGKKEIIQRLYKTDKDFVGSFQGYFIFNTFASTNLNVKIGYQYYFKETIGGAKSSFSIAIGG